MKGKIILFVSLFLSLSVGSPVLAVSYEEISDLEEIKSDVIKELYDFGLETLEQCNISEEDKVEVAAFNLVGKNRDKLHKRLQDVLKVHYSIDLSIEDLATKYVSGASRVPFDTTIYVFQNGMSPSSNDECLVLAEQFSRKVKAARSNNVKYLRFRSEEAFGTIVYRSTKSILIYLRIFK